MPKFTKSAGTSSGPYPCVHETGIPPKVTMDSLHNSSLHQYHVLLPIAYWKQGDRHPCNNQSGVGVRKRKGERQRELRRKKITRINE
jgi:hypothetical protein